VTHANARTTLYARRLIVQRRLGGWPAARIAEQLGIFPRHGAQMAAPLPAGGVGRAGRPLLPPTHQPEPTPAEVETAILMLRRQTHRGPVFLAGQLSLVASTVGRVLRRHHVPPLNAIDPITGAPVRRRHSGIRYERARPGELIHVDVKKLGRVPDGGGWRLHGRDDNPDREHHRGRGIGYDYLHVAVDDHTRLAYVEAHPDERDATAAGFLRRACAWFATHQVRVERVLTDNAKVYRVGHQWATACAELEIGRRFTRPGCPWTNGKAERFNRTLQTEFAYARAWLSHTERLSALDGWVIDYNTRRAHTALGGQPPTSRLISSTTS
jgi:transposase InsO family protein